MDELMADIETIVEMSPESFAEENIREGFCRPEDRHTEVIRYYRLFIKGCNAEIARLHARIKELEQAAQGAVDG